MSSEAMSRTFLDPSREDTRLAFYRNPKDATAVLDRLMDDPKLSGLREWVNGYALSKANMTLA